MPVLKKFNKIVKKMDEWQESCAKFQHDIDLLLHENVSISDISVVKNGFSKKKDLDEAITTQDTRGKFLRRSRMQARTIARDDAQAIKTAISRGEKIIQAGDDVDSNGEKEEVEKKSLQRIRKSEDIIKGDRRLQRLINDYFNLRRTGNFSSAQIKKDELEEIILNRDLDRETVYASYNYGILDSSENDSSEE